MKNYIPVQSVKTQSIAELRKHDDGKTIPFSIQNLKDIKEQEYGDRLVPVHCSYFTILCVRQGSGICIVDMEKMEINDSTIYFIKPGQFLCFDPDENTEGYAISFAQCFLCAYEDYVDSLSISGLFDHSLAATVIPVEYHAGIEMNLLADRIMAEFCRSSPGRNEILRGLLKIFLLYLNRHYAQGSRQFYKPGNTDLAKKFFALVEKNYLNCRTVSDYAKELAVTSNYLNEVVKKTTGVSASSHIQQRVVLEAKRNATHAKMTMKEVAYKLGFDDIYHFSKYFKKASGLNFTEFRREISHQFLYA